MPVIRFDPKHKEEKMKKTLFAILILAAFAGQAFAADLYVGGVLNSPYFVGVNFEVDFGNVAVRTNLSLLTLLAGALDIGSEVKFIKNFSESFQGYGFVGAFAFIPVSTFEPQQKCIEFGVGLEWGQNWVFGIEAGYAFEILPEGEENDTGIIVGGLSLKKRLN